jgi:hypothetical protein
MGPRQVFLEEYAKWTSSNRRKLPARTIGDHLKWDPERLKSLKMHLLMFKF